MLWKFVKDFVFTTALSWSEFLPNYTWGEALYIALNPITFSGIHEGVLSDLKKLGVVKSLKRDPWWMRQEVFQIPCTFSDCEKYTDHSQELEEVCNLIILLITPTGTIYKYLLYARWILILTLIHLKSLKIRWHYY